MQPVSTACGSYFTPLVFLLVVGCVLGGALEKYSIHRMFGLKILSIKAVNHRGDLVVLACMMPCFTLSAFMSNTAAVSTLTPMVCSVVDLISSSVLAGEGAEDALRRKKFAAASLIGLGCAASIGGIMTQLGTPPNILLAA
jgi:sodium-dependent dicarboxylate transporter 2/3/5